MFMKMPGTIQPPFFLRKKTEKKTFVLAKGTRKTLECIDEPLWRLVLYLPYMGIGVQRGKSLLAALNFGPREGANDSCELPVCFLAASVP
jgi:hypothetical protein